MAEETKTPPTYPLFKKALGEQPSQSQEGDGVSPTETHTHEQEQVVVDDPNKGAAPVEEQKKPAEPQELSDEEFLKAHNKRFGTNYKSIEEMTPKAPKSKEEKEEEERRFKNEALTWAIETGNIKREDYEKGIVEKAKKPRDLALSIFHNQLKEEDDKITLAEAEEIFKDTFHEDKDAESRLYKIGQKRIAAMANDYLSANYGSLDSFENAYKEHNTDVQRFSDYGKIVKAEFDNLPKEIEIGFEYELGNGGKENYSFKFVPDEKEVAAIRKHFLSQDMYYGLGANTGDVDMKSLNKAIDFHVKAKMFDRAIVEVAKSAADRATTDTMAYLKGISGNPVLGNKAELGEQKKTAPTYPLLDAAIKRNERR